jgi:putative ABC transport system permease protein
MRSAIRQLIRRPALSVVTTLMLALGLGATTAVFSLFHQILVRPLPVQEPQRLVNLRAPGGLRWGPVRTGSALADWQLTFSYPTFRELATEQKAFTDIAAHYDFEANLTVGSRTRRSEGLLVSGSYFDVLGLKPILGRLIGRQDEPAIGESAVVVLSYDYWESQFGGDPNVVHQTLAVNGQSLEIVGVAPRGFTGTILGWRPQVFVPLTMRWRMQPAAARDQELWNSYWVYLFARLAPGVTVENASSAMTAEYQRLLAERELPQRTSVSETQRAQFLAQPLVLEPGARGQATLRTTTEQPLTLLLALTAFLLAIVCVNIANLLLVRGAARQPEMAVRASLGASRVRLVSQLLAESLLLGGIGCLLSLPVAAITLRVVAAILPTQLAGTLPIELDGKAMAFAAAASLVTALAFGSVPAWRAGNAEPFTAMKGDVASVAARGAWRFRGALGVVQIALSLALLVLAGLFGKSLANIARVDLGLDAHSLVSFSVSPRLNGYEPDRVNTLYDRIHERLEAEPGVVSVGSAAIPLLANNGFYVFLNVPGAEDRQGSDRAALGNIVSHGFLRTTSMRLLAGRDFTEADMRQQRPIAIVNESFVRKFNLGDAVGKHFSIPFVVMGEISIVGVVADAKLHDVKSESNAQFFSPGRTSADNVSLSFYVRGGIDSNALLRAIPRAVADVDPNLPVNDLVTMEQQVDDNVFVDRLIAILSASFAVLATVLAAIGLYGVLAYNVATRTRELGLRLALGARPSQLRTMVLKQLGAMALLGVAMGLAGAVGLGRVAEALLFEVSGYDMWVTIAAIAVLAATVLAASYLPTYRATRVSPMDALRHE